MAADASGPDPILTEEKGNDNGKAAVTKSFSATKNIGLFLDKDIFLWYCSLWVSNT